MTYKKLSGVPESGHPNLTAHPDITTMIYIYKSFAAQSWGGRIRSLRMPDTHVSLTAHPGSNLSERVDFPAPARTRSVD